MPASQITPLVEPNSHQARQNALFWLGCIALYIGLACLYWPSLDYAPLSLDDRSQLAEAAGQSVTELWHRDHFGHFRPSKNLLFWLLSRSATASHWRAVILLMFLSTASAVQTLATRFSESRWLGLGVAMAWAFHPTTASVVCWLSATSQVLALLAMLLYLLLSDLGNASRLSLRQRRGYRALAGGALALGLLSHELALISPLLLFSLDRLRRPGKADWKPYATSLVVIVAYVGLSMAASASVAPLYRYESETPRWLMSFSAARYFGENALLWLWPFGRFGVLLSDDPAAHLVASSAWWVGLLLAGYVLWTYSRRDRVLAFALAWSAISLATLSNFVPLGNTPVAVHYLFIPGVGIATAFTRAIFLLAARLATNRERARTLLIATALALSAGLWFHESSRVVAAWESDEHVYTATLENYPHNVEAMANLSAFYLGVGRAAEAAPLLEEARRLAPADLNVVRNSFSALARANRPQAALELLREHPLLLERSEFLIREGEALQQLQQFPQARDAFAEAFRRADFRLQPEEWCAAGYGLAIAQLQTGVTPAQVRALVERLRVSCTAPELTSLGDLLR